MFSSGFLLKAGVHTSHSACLFLSEQMSPFPPKGLCILYPFSSKWPVKTQKCHVNVLWTDYPSCFRKWQHCFNNSHDVSALLFPVSVEFQQWNNQTAIGLRGSVSISRTLSTSDSVFFFSLNEKVKQFSFSSASGSHQSILTQKLCFKFILWFNLHTCSYQLDLLTLFHN